MLKKRENSLWSFFQVGERKGNTREWLNGGGETPKCFCSVE